MPLADWSVPSITAARRISISSPGSLGGAPGRGRVRSTALRHRLGEGEQLAAAGRRLPCGAAPGNGGRHVPRGRSPLCGEPPTVDDPRPAPVRCRRRGRLAAVGGRLAGQVVRPPGEQRGLEEIGAGRLLLGGVHGVSLCRAIRSVSAFAVSICTRGALREGSTRRAGRCGIASRRASGPATLPSCWPLLFSRGSP